MNNAKPQNQGPGDGGERGRGGLLHEAAGVRRRQDASEEGDDRVLDSGTAEALPRRRRPLRDDEDHGRRHAHRSHANV